MLNQLKAAREAGELRPLDYQFGRFIALHDDAPLAMLAAALTSMELGRGNICLRLDALEQILADKPLLADLAQRTGVAAGDCTAALARSPVCGPQAPLMVEGGRVYLSRYWHYERQLAQWLAQAAAQPAEAIPAEALRQLFARDYSRLYIALEAQRRQGELNAKAFAASWLDLEHPQRVDWPAVDALLKAACSPEALAALDALIPASACLNWQQLAAAVAVSRRFTVISGGPGTGKTTTVTKLLALLARQGLTAGQQPLIRLVAPTGKAAARLTESIVAARAALPLAADISEAVTALIPSQASTIHRLLGVLPGQAGFRHHRDNRLHLDILVVDEASMVDLPLMAKLLQALPEGVRLILLGDKDQLASVEAGAVLGDICRFVEQGYSPRQAARLADASGFELASYQQPEGSALRDCLCLLRKSYRFDARSGIGRLAAEVNGGRVKPALALLEQGAADIDWFPWSDAHYRRLLTLCVEGYRGYLEAIAPVSLPDEARMPINAFAAFQLLTALREGQFGVSGLNQRIEQALEKAGLLALGGGEWYPGRPVIITRNDHGLGLYNGDIGIALPTLDGPLKVFFEMSDGQIRGFMPSRLPTHDTVFAMTIHKSQGSEFSHTVLALPAEMSPVLTRELVYTGITRARQRLSLFAHPGVLGQAIGRRTERASGLVEQLAALSVSTG